jgi:hypothetical protein
MAQGTPQGAPGGGSQKQGGGISGIDNSNLDLTPAYEATDLNKDGKIPKEEWLKAGFLPIIHDALFSIIMDSNKDGVVSKEEFLKSKPMFETDFNKDGKATFEEFFKATKQAAENRIAKEAAKNSGDSGHGQGGPSGEVAPAGLQK